MRKLIVLGPTALLLVMLAACSSSNGGDSELNEAIASLRTRDLDVLVLPASEIGRLARGFQVDPGSGPIDNATAAENSINPDDTERDFERKGRISGYSLDYSNPNAETDGVFQVGTTVSLWEDAAKAAASLKEALEEFQSFEGEEVDGVVLAKVETFNVSGLGDEARGVRIELEVVGFGSFYGTAVYVRMGRLGLNSNLLALDEEDYEQDVVTMARRHVQWVTDVLKGEIDPDPVTIPEPVEPGPDGPPLDAVSLQASDLPDGFVETERGFNTTNPAGIYDYTSTYESVSEYAPIGNSLIASIENNIIVYDTSIEAQAFIGAIAGLLEGDSGAEFMLQIFQAEGVPANRVETERRDIDFGDQTVAVTARADTDLGNVILSFILVRTGATVTTFIVVGDADTYDLQDIGPIVEDVVDRVVNAGIN